MIPLKQYFWLAKLTKLGLKLRISIYLVLFALVIFLFSNPFVEYSELAPDKALLVNRTFEEAPLKFTFHKPNVSAILPNCGIRKQCPKKTFPVHIYTGQDKDDKPEFCINGKYISGPARGINVAVIDSRYMSLLQHENFDLYSHNSSKLEQWLEGQLNEDDIVIAFTFDEASKELSNRAKAIFYDLGSGKIQDLQFRSQWYMISQKGIKGFTPLENITYAKNNIWGEVINERMCVPSQIEPIAVSPNPAPRTNPSRKSFCETCPQLQCEDFCNPLAVHEPLVPSVLTNRSLIGNGIFSTPMLVIAGESLSSVVLTLESILYQPGVQPKSIFVLSTVDQEHVPALSKLFSFNSIVVNSSLTFEEKLEIGIETIIERCKKAYVIILEPSLILSPDFLFYLAQLIPVMEKDDSILGISAWNPYGYVTSSGNPHAVYRTENFPGLGVLIPISTYLMYMKGQMDLCCTSTTFSGWDHIITASKGKQVLTPDISRVLKRPKDIYSSNMSESELRIFTQPRITSTDESAWIDRPYDLISERYFQKVAGLVQSSITFYLTKGDLNLCENGTNIALTTLLRELKNKVISVFVKSTNKSNTEMLSHMTCFGIMSPTNAKVHNLYMKLLRLTVDSNTVFIIDASSPFAKNRQMSMRL